MEVEIVSCLISQDLYRDGIEKVIMPKVQQDGKWVEGGGCKWEMGRKVDGEELVMVQYDGGGEFWRGDWQGDGCG